MIPYLASPRGKWRSCVCVYSSCTMVLANLFINFSGMGRWSLLQRQWRAVSTAITELASQGPGILPRMNLPTSTSTSSPSLHVRNYSSTLSDFSSRTLQGESPRQFLTSDQETIVCVHPSSSVDISDTKVYGSDGGKRRILCFKMICCLPLFLASSST